jgi:hypothetical protein
MGRKSALKLTHNGITDTLPSWAKRLGITYNSLYARLYTLKWPVEVALSHSNLRPRSKTNKENTSDS